MQQRTLCWTLICALFLSVAADPASARSKKHRRGQKKKPKASLYLDSGPKPRLQVRNVQGVLEELLELRKEIRFVPLADVLEDKREARKALTEAGKMTEKGKELLSNLEVEEGVKAIAEGVKMREQSFHVFYNDPNELEAHAWLLADLAVAYYMAGDEDKTRKSLLQAFLLHATMEFDEKRFPPQMKQLFGESRFLADEMGTGDVYIETQPAGAEVRVNGKLIGHSPTTARGLGTGENLITVSLVGYMTHTQRVSVQGGGESTQVTMDLAPLEASPIPALQEGLAAASNGGAAPNLATLSKTLKLPVIFLASVAGEDDMITVTLFAYDGRKKKLVGKVSGSISALDPEPECRELINTIMGSLSMAPVRKPKVAQEEQGEPWFKKFRQSKWFWPAVGIAAGAVVAAGTTVGIYYGTRSNEAPDHRRTLIILPSGAPGIGF